MKASRQSLATPLLAFALVIPAVRLAAYIESWHIAKGSCPFWLIAPAHGFVLRVRANTLLTVQLLDTLVYLFLCIRASSLQLLLALAPGELLDDRGRRVFAAPPPFF